MALPNELILEVCGHLAKRDLKACRFVSKSWSHHASEYLFSNIYISPRKEDIEVFDFVTQHAQLSHCVRYLIYDSTSFSPSYSEFDYINHLFEQATEYSDLYRKNLNGTDLQFTQFVKSCWEASATPFGAVQEFSGHDFILNGNREWEARDKYQQRIVKNGDFLQILTCGLRKLDFLDSVEVCDEWDTERLSDRWGRQWPNNDMTKDPLDPYFYGSPFGRAWGLSHPKPHSGIRDTSDEEGFATGHEEFQIITTALSQSQRKIRSFDISEPPVSIFDSNVTDILMNHSFNAYSKLEYLTLYLEDYMGSIGMTVKYESLPGLKALLGSMSGLRHLELDLPGDEWHGNACFNYRQVFPTSGTQWMRLTRLDIDTLAISVTDLVHLLAAKMPNLRELILSDVELLEGRWEGVVEFLKTSMHLLCFPLHESWQKLLHLEGRSFLDDQGDDKQNLVFRTDIETYVVHGGRHPCLRADEDVSASSNYLLGLCL